MKEVEIYTSPLCGFCHAAKRLLTSKDVNFAEVDIAVQPERRAEMMQRANGGRTVPQIFIGEEHVGGCDDLFALERAGKLDAVLAAYMLASLLPTNSSHAPRENLAPTSALIREPATDGAVFILTPVVNQVLTLSP